MTPPATVSVVVPTLNRAPLLREALASIRALEGSDLQFEILVADNGSVDETHAVADEFEARWLSVATRGAAAARNAGLEAATGEFIAFLDDDDAWYPGHVRPQVALLRARQEFGGAVGQAVLVDGDLRRTWGPFPYDLPDDGRLFRHFLRDYPQIGATVIRRSVIPSVGTFRESLIGDQDWEWHLRLARCTNLGFVPVECVAFRQRALGTQDDLQWRRLRYMHAVMLRQVGPALREGIWPHTFARIYVSHMGRYFRYFRDSPTPRSTLRATVASPPHALVGLATDGAWRSHLRSHLSR